MDTAGEETPLSIAILGGGNIGSAFAYQLARAGHDVTVIARPGSKRLKQLQRDKAIVLKSGERADIKVLERLDEQASYTFVIVTVLAHQLESVLPALQRSSTECIEFLFNTFHPERLKDAVGAHRCEFGMPFIQSLLDADGRLDATIAANPKTIHSSERLVKLFTTAGIPSNFEADMPLWLRCHVPLCIAFESISVAGQNRNGGASWTEAVIVARGMHAAFAIIKSSGFRVYPNLHAIASSCPTVVTAAILWLLSRNSAFRELLASGAGECRALIDDIVETSATIPATEINAVRAMRP